MTVMDPTRTGRIDFGSYLTWFRLNVGEERLSFITQFFEYDGSVNDYIAYSE